MEASVAGLLDILLNHGDSPWLNHHVPYRSLAWRTTAVNPSTSVPEGQGACIESHPHGMQTLTRMHACPAVGHPGYACSISAHANATMRLDQRNA